MQRRPQSLNVPTSQLLCLHPPSFHPTGKSALMSHVTSQFDSMRVEYALTALTGQASCRPVLSATPAAACLT